MYQPPNMNNSFSNYYDQNPMQMMQPLAKKAPINYYRMLEGTQKTLVTINQVIPLVTRVAPMMRNASTMLKVANAVKKMPDNFSEELYTPSQIYSTVDEKEPTNPTFF